jgi:hypothetical protein
MCGSVQGGVRGLRGCGVSPWGTRGYAAGHRQECLCHICPAFAAKSISRDGSAGVTFGSDRRDGERASRLLPPRRLARRWVRGAAGLNRKTRMETSPSMPDIFPRLRPHRRAGRPARAGADACSPFFNPTDAESGSGSAPLAFRRRALRQPARRGHCGRRKECRRRCPSSR